MENIKNILLKLLEFKTIESNKLEFEKLFYYVKEICNKNLFIIKNVWLYQIVILILLMLSFVHT